MRTLTIIALCAIVGITAPRTGAAQVAGQAKLGVTVEEMRLVLQGWSARRDLLEKPVYNDAHERIGELEDIIVSPNRQVSWAIIDVEGFLGIDERRVAIPVDQLRFNNQRWTLPGATKDEVRRLPPFEYAKR
jgi:hypothetical protein